MTTTRLVISDLHLADGTLPLDCFGPDQQAAFAGLLLAASPNGPLASSPDHSVELIINGDCFDFLATPPYSPQRTTSQAAALLKIDAIISAHPTFFAALRTFLAHPNRSITFITGNHDIELCFANIRIRLYQAITGQDHDPRIHFCLTRCYRPSPDVHIEHGNHYDFWNHAFHDLWDPSGQPLSIDPPVITIPTGTWYFQVAAHPISIRYPFFDHLDPQMSNLRQIGLLCLLDPPLLLDVAQRTMSMLSYPRTACANLAPGEETNPVRLFEEITLDFLAFRSDMEAQDPDWSPTAISSEVSTSDMLEFSQIHEALTLPPVAAVAALFTPQPEEAYDTVTQGMHNVLNQDPTLRYAIAGHTHMARTDTLNHGTQCYLNTASWTDRFAQPTPEAVTPTLLDWLQHPDLHHAPLPNNTQFTFALLTTEPHQPTHATLCAWQGGLHGNYHLLSST